MPLPELTDSGELPLGAHRCSRRSNDLRLDTRSESRWGNGWNESITWPRQPGTWRDLPCSGHS